MKRLDPDHVVVYSDTDQFAGAEAALGVVLAHLPTSRRVTVMGPSSPVLDRLGAVRPGAGVVPAPPVRGRRDLRNLIATRRLLRRSGAGVLHLHKTDVGSLRYVDAIARTIPRLHVVAVTHHVETPATRPTRLLSRLLARLPGAQVAVGDHVARELEGLLGLGPGAVHAVPNATAVPAARPASPRQRFTVATLARLVPHKRVELLIHAVAGLADVDLIIGGDGPERRSLQSLVRDLGVADRVSFAGWAATDEILARCDVLALASDREGWPMAVVEAHAAGVAVIATAVGSVPELVEHGRTGLLVPPGDVEALRSAIAQVAGDPALARQLGETARQVATERRTPEHMAGQYEDIYLRRSRA